MFDRDIFFDNIRLPVFQGMTDSQVQGCEAILTAIETHGVTDLRFGADILGTAFWETARTMEPIEEIGHGRHRAYGAPAGPWHQVFDGRGDVQLTWLANYAKATKLLQKLGVLAANEDMTKTPDLALRPDVAAAVMIFGMVDGWFTGKKLGDFFTPTKSDWVGARRIINGVDKAAIIAGISRQFWSALKAASYLR